MANDKPRLTIALRPETYAAIKRIAAKDQRTLSEVINMLFRLGLFVYDHDERGGKLTLSIDGKDVEVMII